MFLSTQWLKLLLRPIIVPNTMPSASAMINSTTVSFNKSYIASIINVSTNRK